MAKISETIKALVGGNKLRILGRIYPATKDDFMRFIAEANVLEGQGYELHSFVRLDKTIAAVFRRTRKEPMQYSSFSGEDEDEEPIETFGR